MALVTGEQCGAGARLPPWGFGLVGGNQEVLKVTDSLAENLKNSEGLVKANPASWKALVFRGIGCLSGQSCSSEFSKGGCSPRQGTLAGWISLGGEVPRMLPERSKPLVICLGDASLPCSVLVAAMSKNHLF